MENAAGAINIQFLVVLLQVGYIRAHQFHSCPAFRTLPEPQCGGNASECTAGDSMPEVLLNTL